MKNYFKSKFNGHYFNYNKKPSKNIQFLKIITNTLSLWGLRNTHFKLIQTNMDKISQPFILLPNHNNFNDYFVIIRALCPKSQSWLSGTEGFLGIETLFRAIGGIPKRPFFNDNIYTTHNCQYVLNRLKQNLVIFPEGHYGIYGQLQPITPSFAKLLKILDAPIVTIKMQGNYLRQPFWNPTHRRNTKITAEMTGLFSKEELQAASHEVVYEKLVEALKYDEFEYQKANNIQITDPHNAEGLEDLLYQCPHCRTEFQMATDGNDLFCEACGKRWHLDPLNRLHAVADNEPTYFETIPQWYHWIVEQVAAEVHSGNYCTEGTVYVDFLPNSKGFIALGEGFFHHDKNGLTLSFNQEGKETVITRPTYKIPSIRCELRTAARMQPSLYLATQKAPYYLYFKDLPHRTLKVKIAAEILYHTLVSRQK